MNQSNIAQTYTPTDTMFFFSSVATDASAKTSNDLWVHETPIDTSSLMFWSPTMRDEDALPPNDPIWTKIDAMLEKAWASVDIITLEEEERLYAEMQEIERIAEMRRFEELYGAVDDWE